MREVPTNSRTNLPTITRTQVSSNVGANMRTQVSSNVGANMRTQVSPGLAPDLNAKPGQILIAMAGAFSFALLILGSKTLAVPFAFLGAAVPLMVSKRKIDKRKNALANIWPELLDHMISGLRSGLSIAETLTSLAHRGPEVSRPIFVAIERDLRGGMEISSVFKSLKAEFNDPVADQVCEVLDFARGTGSRDTALTLRTLGDFIRSDIAVRGEIRAKLGWVKNSAIVAAVAPWILLAILSAQPSTLAAFSTPTGIIILITGVIMSLVAYLWMGRVGRIPEIPRIFNGENDPHKRDAGNQHKRDGKNQHTRDGKNQHKRDASNQHKRDAKKFSNRLNHGQAVVGNFETARGIHA